MRPTTAAPCAGLSALRGSSLQSLAGPHRDFMYRKGSFTCFQVRSMYNYHKHKIPGILGYREVIKIAANKKSTYLAISAFKKKATTYSPTRMQYSRSIGTLPGLTSLFRFGFSGRKTAFTNPVGLGEIVTFSFAVFAEFIGSVLVI